MTEVIMKEIFARLDQVAAKLGTSTEHLWGVLVKQGIVEAAMALVYIVVALAFLLTFKNLYYNWDIESHNDNEMKKGFLIVPIGFIAAIMLIVALGHISNIGYFINPEMYALEFVKNALTPGK